MEAIILAGGEGKRLRPLTETRPKPMVEVLGKPILLYQVQHLKKYGVKRFVIACRYRWNVIRDFFGDGKDFGVEIIYSVEKTPLGRGGAVKEAYQKVLNRKKPVIATNGDNLFDVNIGELVESHDTSGASATVTLVQLRSPYGIVETEGPYVRAFKEKIVLPHWINAGVYALSPEAVRRFPNKGDHERSTFPDFATKGKLSAYYHRGYWKAVDNMKDLTEAEKFLSSKS